MRIAYGIHGYGRGHAVRALAVLPELTRRHEMLVLAGGDAYQALRGDHPVQRIPTLRYQLGKGGRRSGWQTLAQATPKLLDLGLGGPALELVCDMLAEFAPDAVVSDSDAWTHHAARRLKLPRISFDHYGVLAYCRWPMSPADRVACRMEALAYRRLMAGTPDRIVVASFYPAPPRREGVCVVGPVLRQAVLAARADRGDHLLVYFSNGRHHVTPRVERALRALALPVVVYGVGREGVEGNLDFRPPGNVAFVADLARCRAVFATAGNQLISEAIHLRKPLLLLPEDSLEQRLNAAAVERMGIGTRTSRRRVCAEILRAFLAAEPRFAEHLPPPPPAGQPRAVEAIERYAAELDRQERVD